VGVITYNHEPFIAQCLESILTQKTDFPFEVVVGEDCSTDNTRAIVQKYASLYPGILKPIYHPVNVGGVRNAYEFVYRKLSGKYIALCEGDDFWTDDCKLQKQADFLEQHPEISFCFHRVDFVNQEGKLLLRQPVSTTVVMHSAARVFHLKIQTSSVMFRNCMAEVPPEMFRVKSCDTFLFGLLACYGGAADLGFLGGCYRKHAGGVYTGSPVIQRYLQTLETLRVMKRSGLFSAALQSEIDVELRIRKKRYIKQFLKKNDMLNSLKIAFS